MEAQSQTKRPTLKGKANPRDELEGPNLAQGAHLKVKIRPRKPTWRPKASSGDQLADPSGQGGQLRGPKTSQDAKLEAERFPRRPTLEAKGGPGRQLGAKMDRKEVPKGAKRLQK